MGLKLVYEMNSDLNLYFTDIKTFNRYVFQREEKPRLNGELCACLQVRSCLFFFYLDNTPTALLLCGSVVCTLLAYVVFHYSRRQQNSLKTDMIVEGLEVRISN